MPRRFLAIIAAALALFGATGCADDVSPAVRVGDVKIGNDAFLAEVAEWHRSPTLLSLFGLSSAPEGVQSYPTSDVGIVLSNRISFEAHNAQFDELGLELTKQEVSDMRAGGLLNDPAATETMLKELSPEYGDRLAEDVARQFAVQNALGDGYEAWAAKALSATEVEVNPRYGTWDSATSQVVAPAGPVQPADAVPAQP